MYHEKSVISLYFKYSLEILFDFVIHRIQIACNPLRQTQTHAYSTLKNTNSAFKKGLFCSKNLLS